MEGPGRREGVGTGVDEKRFCQCTFLKKAKKLNKKKK